MQKRSRQLYERLDADGGRRKEGPIRLPPQQILLNPAAAEPAWPELWGKSGVLARHRLATGKRRPLRL